MTSPDSPSSLLERAAVAIEQRAAHFEDYRETWRSWPSQYGGPVEVWTYDVTEGNASQAAKQWVEMMSPAVAQPLVEWLRTTARFMHYEGGAVSGAEKVYPFLAAKYAGAIAFARAVLGESE